MIIIIITVEAYGCWGMEAQQSLQLAARLAIQMGCNKSQATTILYQRLSLSLVRANARALLSRAFRGGGLRCVGVGWLLL